VIHGDMKWDNLLVLRGKEGKPEIRIVDWELVDLGDASWDIGSIFAAYLLHWLLFAGAGQVPTAAGGAAWPLMAVQPALRAFWNTYAAARQIQAVAQWQYLERCVRFAAARLVLIAFEYVYNNPQAMPHAVNLLQLSQNLFLNPRQGAMELVGVQGTA
jgi:aminoglycoside phosphotransferase (APT) family kinase protein